MPDYSRDLWDYLTEIPYMPSRRDRDELVRMADENPKHAKRIQIWDYFFRLNRDDIGKPQQREMGLRAVQRQQDHAANNARALRMMWLAFLPIMGGGVIMQLFQREREWYLQYAGYFVIALGVGILFTVGFLFWRMRSRINREYVRAVDRLTKFVEMLRRKIPVPPDDPQMHRWLQEDIEWLSGHAIHQTGIDASKVKPAHIANPLCILGPAQLQSRDLIPRPFLDKQQIDLGKHLHAARFAFLPDDQFEDFYGVYSVEFIVLGESRLANYGCFFDFITGKIYGEHKSEMYYKDVVSLSVRDEYRQVNMPWLQTQTVRAPTFSMSLASGNTIEISFASIEYVNALKLQMPAGTTSINPAHWVRNPETAARHAVEALREELKKHKG
jgi:hypothetical protein